MKDADLSIEQIAQIVELKVDEVKAILNEKNQVLLLQRKIYIWLLKTESKLNQWNLFNSIDFSV